MSIRIGDNVIEYESIEWGVLYDDGDVIPMEDESDAMRTAFFTGGKVVAQVVYETAWAEVPNKLGSL